MSDRELPLLLLDIKIAIQSILDYTNGYTSQVYEQDVKTRHAVERNFLNNRRGCIKDTQRV